MRKIYILILFFLINKSLSQNNTLLTSGPVCIGTTNPEYQLDVQSANQRLFNLTGPIQFRIELGETSQYAGFYLLLISGLAKIGDTINNARIDVNTGNDITGTGGMANFQLSGMNSENYIRIFYRYNDLVGM